MNRISTPQGNLASMIGKPLSMARSVLFCLASFLISSQAVAECSHGKGFACWFVISHCAIAGVTGDRNAYANCVSLASNNWCTECIVPGPADPNCPPGSGMQGGVCLPVSAVFGLKGASLPGYVGRSVAPNADGRLELLGIDQAGRIAHNWQSGGAGLFQPSSYPFPGSVSAAGFPVMVMRLDGRLEVLVASRSGLITRSAQLAPNVNWGDWTTISQRRFAPSGVAAGVSPDDQLVVAAIDAAGYLWTSQEQNGVWSQWQQLGSEKFKAVPVMASNADGRLEIFGVSTNGALMHAWQTGSDGDFTQWQALSQGPFTGVPAVMRNLDQRLEVFASRMDGTLSHAWQVAPNGGWSNEAPTPGTHKFDPAMNINQDGTLSVFVVGVNDQAVWTRRQAQPNGSWDDWKSLGGVVKSAPAVGRNADGSLQVFAVGQDGMVWSSRQESPSATTWKQWMRLGLVSAGL
ncbi:hypothetical protein [Variovorax sp. dw_308]|uniref:hypothetical protein n=1 Tax=Variovorax sp. dw_308 TaxID=2721546 RepID=UPI001C4370AC|nr:hypothetical protein [Variovorax sp. dw_308]